MKHVPWFFKLGASVFVSYQLSKRLYHKQLYDPEVYRLAIKYRHEFDKSVTAAGAVAEKL